MKVLGFQRKSYDFEGHKGEGYNLWLAEERPGVDGVAAERYFVSDRKLGTYLPKVGDKLTVSFNRFGKIQSVALM